MTYPTADLPQITDLHADIVPHNYWALSAWYRANPVWQYHRRASGEELVARPVAGDEPVDPEIRDFCALLARHGLRTTVACQGHFYPQSHFQRVWDELTWEAEFIRSVGLVVLDAGTRSPVVFRNPEYYLPWFNFEEFHRRASEELAIGYVGIVLPEEDERAAVLKGAACEGEVLRIGMDAEAEGALNRPVLGVTVHPTTVRDRARAWQRVTLALGELLWERAAVQAAGA